MARRRLTDKLQDHLFWAFDATVERAVPVFTPLFGFSAITAPEMGVEVESFKDGTYLYPRHTVKGATASPVTFERAASMFDSDFYSWITYAIHGDKGFETGGTLSKIGSFFSGGTTTFRRTLLVVHFARINLSRLGGGVGGPALDPAEKALAGIGTAALAALTSGSVVGAGLALAGGVGFFGIGPFEDGLRLPARGWLLHDCIPVNYKAGSDFDATSGAISIQELEVQPEYIEEFSLGIKP